MEAGKSTVLIVEDNGVFRDMLEEVMQEENYAVISAANGVEALEKIEEATPDVILLDQIMPEMDGMTMLRELKKREMADRTILMLLLDDINIPANAGIPSAYAAFTKPFNLTALCGAVKSCLHNTAAREQLLS